MSDKPFDLGGSFITGGTAIKSQRPTSGVGFSSLSVGWNAEMQPSPASLGAGIPFTASGSGTAANKRYAVIPDVDKAVIDTSNDTNNRFLTCI